VDDLLELSRITRGTIELRREPIELSSVIEGALETSRPVIEAAGHALKIEMEEGPLVLDADQMRLSQVVSNLLNNAAKYTDAGGEIRLIVEREGDTVLVRVRDTGIGIPADMLPRVFEIFTQVNRTNRDSQGGLGIGLALVRTLVTMHGGTVEAHSAGIGCGSEFIVRLPLIPSDLLVGQGAIPASDTQASCGMRVLIVDDNRDAAETLGVLLDSIDCRTELAFNGRSALSAMDRFRPDVVFLDLGLPGMDGYEIARRIRARSEFNNVVLIALSGWGKEEDCRRSQEAGINHHLIKPAEFEAIRTLLEMIRSANQTLHSGTTDQSRARSAAE
jgi:CheY-like chemotaxis protein